MLVVQVEPRPARLRRQPHTRRHWHRRVPQGRQHMPRRRHHQEHGCRGQHLQPEQRAKLPRERKIQNNKANREHHTDQAFRQHAQRQHCAKAHHRAQRASSFPNAVQRAEEQMHRNCHPQRNQDVRDIEPRVQVWPNRSRHGDCRIQTRPVTRMRRRNRREEPVAQRIHRKQQRQHAQRERQSRCPVMDAKHPHRRRRHPVHQRRFVEEPYPVNRWRNEVVALQHLPSNLDVHRINVVQQPRREQPAKLQNAPQQQDDGNRAGAPAAERGSDRHGIGSFSTAASGRSVRSCLPDSSNRTKARGPSRA